MYWIIYNLAVTHNFWSPVSLEAVNKERIRECAYPQENEVQTTVFFSLKFSNYRKKTEYFHKKTVIIRIEFT
jgi:hypothetical protein